MNDPFDYNATPMAPPGIRTLVYENPQQRKTWAQHGVNAWYIGYYPDHYRCHKTYVPANRGERIYHTVSFSLHDFAVTSNNHQDYVARSIRDLTTALQNRYLHTLLQPVGDKKFAAIQVLEQMFCPNLPGTQSDFLQPSTGAAVESHPIKYQSSNCCGVLVSHLE